MITKIVKVDKEHPDEAAIKEAGEILKNGKSDRSHVVL